MIIVYLYPGEPNPNDVRLRDPNVLEGGPTIVEADGHAEGAAFVFGDSDVPVPVAIEQFSLGGRGREEEEDILRNAEDDLEVVTFLAHFLGRNY